MISAVADATVPKICVVLRKAYGAGLYAMCGPGFEPDATIALPQAMIAVMGAEAAVNAVYSNKIAGEARGRARRLRRAAARGVPRRTSTSTSSRPSCTSTRSCRATSCAPSCSAGFAAAGARASRGYRAGAPCFRSEPPWPSRRWLTLIPADEARRILAETPPVGHERVRAARRRAGACWRDAVRGAGRTCRPSARSVMDGYAVRAADVARRVRAVAGRAERRRARCRWATCSRRAWRRARRWRSRPAAFCPPAPTRW